MVMSGCVVHSGHKAAKCSKADLKLLAGGSAGVAQAGLLLGGGGARGRGGLLHPGLGLPQHLQHQSLPSIPNTNTHNFLTAQLLMQGCNTNPRHQHCYAYLACD